MKAVLLTFLILSFSELIFGQADTISLDHIDLMGCFEVPPKYPGGFEGIKKLFADSMRCPKEAEKQKVAGRVVVTYMVDTFGNTQNIKIYKSAGKEFDEEAVRLVRMLKGWKPATLNDKKVIYYQSQPFVFVPYVSKMQRIVRSKNNR